jgi:hypothetical protein
MTLVSPIKIRYKGYNEGDKMKTLKNNPASFHYHAILKDAVINPTKAYFLTLGNAQALMNVRNMQ